jgi:hypothetical protein
MVMKSSTAENLARSAKAPRIRQQVIAANVAWKATYTSSGSGVFFENVAALANSPFKGSKVPFRNNRSKPPKYGLNAPLPSVNARL